MVNKENQFRVIIIGGDHYNTYGVIRSLGKEGISCDVILLDCKIQDSFVLSSKYVYKGYGCTTHEEAISCLKNNYDNRYKNIILCCSDEAEELVLNHYNELISLFSLPVCNEYKDTLCLMNKNVITDLAKEYGIRVPQTCQVLNRQIPNGIKYPCITKPIISTAGQKSDIVVCNDEDELRAIVEDQKRCADYVVQDYIKFNKEVSILGAALANGEIVLSGCIDKLRTCMIGTTSFGVMVDNCLLGDNVVKLEAMIRSIGYKGLFSAEFLKRGDDFFFLEVNFRNDGNTYVATSSGMNLPFLYVQSIIDPKNVLKKSNPIYPCYFMLDIEDFITRRRNQVSFRRWLADCKQANSFLVFNKEDRKPFYRKIVKLVSYSLRRRIGKLKNNTK